MKNLSGVLAVLALTLTACSTQTGYYTHAEYKPVAYQADHSRAWNNGTSPTQQGFTLMITKLPNSRSRKTKASQ